MVTSEAEHGRGILQRRVSVWARKVDGENGFAGLRKTLACHTRNC